MFELSVAYVVVLALAVRFLLYVWFDSDLLASARQHLEVRSDHIKDDLRNPVEFLSALLACKYCLGFWLCLGLHVGVYLLDRYLPGWGSFCLNLFGSVGALYALLDLESSMNPIIQYKEISAHVANTKPAGPGNHREPGGDESEESSPCPVLHDDPPGSGGDGGETT